MMNIISLGAGVQSSTMALMAKHGEITPMPDAAIFADTNSEPRDVYQWLDWLEKQLPFPVYRTTNGDLRADSLDTSRGYARRLIPMYLEAGGFLGRACTAEYKVKPIRKMVKAIAGFGHRFPKETAVIQWLGISIDEIQRMKAQVEPWQDFRHPLIELKMTRGDCLAWMQRRGYPEPPRSACTFCPFHSNDEWRRLHAYEFEDAVEFEQEIQELMKDRLDSTPYLHSARVPLTEAIDRDEPAQMSFLDECAGLCGV